jgi:orotidine-5'-phosphate decarboxylase
MGHACRSLRRGGGPYVNVPSTPEPCGPPPLRRFPDDVSQRLIVALDVPTLRQAREMADVLRGQVSFFKVGMWLLFRPGVRALVRSLTGSGAQVFLDYKMYDIGETVGMGIRSIRPMHPRFVTVHGDVAAMTSAVRGMHGTQAGILAVTVLTSMDDVAMAAQGFAHGALEMAVRIARDAVAAGCQGIVASAADHPDRLREATGSESLLVVTPGIRMPGDASGDQRRTCTPAQAVRNGADYLVVGRPVVRNTDPEGAVRRILEDMATGLAHRG